MFLKKMLPALLFLLLLTASAQAVTLAPTGPIQGENGFSYAFTLPENQFAIVEYKGKNESGKTVVYGPNGQFNGCLPLPYTDMGGEITVSISSLKEKQLDKATVTIPMAPGYAAPDAQADSYSKVTDLKLTETPEGFAYAFHADADYMLLSFRNRQMTGTLPVYRQNDEGLFEGAVDLPLTYARTLSTVTIQTGSGVPMAEGQVRKGYQAPAPAQRQPGRLSGVIVCIDPGHQENGKPVSEPKGPGLEGKTAGSGGMAQGKFTQRREAIVTLETGMALRDELLRQGATVVMTRERQDAFLTNRERCQVAADANAHMMLRLHCDTQASASKRGLSIYSPLHSTYAQAVADPPEYRAMAELLLNAMKRRLGYELTQKTGFVTLSDQFVGNNWAQMPCFLIEMGFMSNAEEDYLLSTPTYQQWLAEGMAQGVYEIAVHRGIISGE